MVNDAKIKRNKKMTVAIVVGMIALVLIACLVGSVVAKYMAEERELAEVLSDSFHISSDYLEKKTTSNPDAKQYTVTDWGYHEDYQIAFKLYNYEKENVALISAKDIHYNINAEGWRITVKDKNGSVIAPSDGVYTLSSDGTTRNEYTVYLKRIVDTTTTAAVVVSTVDPFATSLFAVFELKGDHGYSVDFEDHTNYVKVIIDTNNYNGDLSVSWNDDFSPDNTHPMMKDWRDSSKPETFTVEEQSTYELIFFKNSTGASPEQGIVINTEE